MKCSKCGDKVIVIRPYYTEDNDTIRHLKCRKCGHEMYSIETEVDYSRDLRLEMTTAETAYRNALKDKRKNKEGDSE